MKQLKSPEDYFYGETVRVYRNLTKKCWSVQRKTEKGWRLWFHDDRVNLTNARFVVSRSGQERVRRECKKYVHAYVHGTLSRNSLNSPCYIFRVHYNPYTDNYFHTEYGEVKFDIHASSSVCLTDKGEVFCE